MVLCYKGGGEMKKHVRSRIVFIATDQVKVKWKVKSKNYIFDKPGRGRLSRHKTLVNIYICLILSSGDVGDASSRSVMKPRKLPDIFFFFFQIIIAENYVIEGVPSLGILKILRLQVKSHCLEISDLLFLSRAKTY